MRIVQLSGIDPILGVMKRKSYLTSKIIRLRKLKNTLSKIPSNGFQAHMIRNEVNRLEGKAERLPQGSLRDYAAFLQDRLKMYKDRKGLSWLINKELKLILANKFTGSTATGKSFADISGIGRRKKRKGFFRKIGKGLKKAFKSLKTVSLAVPRNAFLGLLKVNVRGLASKLKRAPKDKIFRLWDRFGGKRSSLEKAISKGANKKPLLGSRSKGSRLRRKISGFSEGDYMILDSFNDPFNKKKPAIGEPVTATAIIGASAPILIKFLELLKKEGLDTPEGGTDIDTGEKNEGGFGSVLDNIIGTVKGVVGSGSVDEALPPSGFTVSDVEAGAVPDAGYPSDDPEINEIAEGKSSVTISPVLIGAAALGVFLLMKK